MSERDERFERFRAQAMPVIDEALRAITAGDAQAQDLRLWVDVANVGVSEAERQWAEIGGDERVTSAGVCAEAELPDRSGDRFRLVLPLPVDAGTVVRTAWDLAHGIA